MVRPTQNIKILSSQSKPSINGPYKPCPDHSTTNRSHSRSLEANSPWQPPQISHRQQTVRAFYLLAANCPKTNSSPSMVDAYAVVCAAKWIASLIQKGQYLYGIEDLVRELHADLECMQELLYKVDSDPSLVKENGQLRIFAQKIRELAFRAEDAIDIYVVDVGAKIYGKALPVKLARLLSYSYPLYMLRKEIEAIQKEIQKANKRFETFGMIIQKQDAISSSQRRQTDNGYVPRENYIHLDEVVVGIDDAVSQLVERLTDPNDHFRVLGIVGTGGAGKSTLAAQLYRHSQVLKVFPRKAFVSVSQKWSKSDLLTRIYKQLKGDKQSKGDTQFKGDQKSKEDDIPSSEEELVKQICNFIKENRCLVILDDVWRKDDWDFFCRIFPNTSEVEVGYRVILTTRIEEVPLHADNRCVIHEPKLLTENQKWELFSKLAMEGRSQIQEIIDEYEKLGRQMLEKCPGLPLAVVTLAGILRTKTELYQWEDISKACRDNILKGKGRPNYGVVEDMLELSYLDLPIYLKSCFLYLATVPEDYDITAEWLIQLWIAEGFITRKEQETLEDVGRRLVDELTQRCILQVTKRNAQNQIFRFRIHDLMRDLCVKKAEEYRFVGTISATCANANARGSNQPSQPRRVAISSWKNVTIESRSVRSIFDYAGSEELSDEVRVRKLKQLERCKLLRVLEWYGAVPKRIGKFIHLRYLFLKVGSCGQIPKSIKNLRNLFTFWFSTTEDEVEVPNDLFCNIENLRVLGLPSFLKRGSESFNSSLGLTCLKNLQRLHSGAGKWMLNELPTLSPTVRVIHIHNIQTREEIEAVYQCPSVVEDRLCELLIAVDLDARDLEFDLQKVGHCKTLSELLLCGCPIMGVPEFPPNLVNLSLFNIKVKKGEYDLMQALGELSNLKILRLVKVGNCGKVVSWKAGAFPQLRELELSGLDTLEEWMMEEGAMPRLTNLTIRKCLNLNRLTQSIQSIRTIKELRLRSMPENFLTRLGLSDGGESRVVGEDSYIIRHIPRIICDRAD